jgi:hypothetical protein
MLHPRLFARVRPKGQVSTAAKIIVAPQATAIDCTIVDYSPGGACLEVCGQITLVPRFELLWGATKKEVPGRLEVRKPNGRRSLALNAVGGLRRHSLFTTSMNSGANHSRYQ